MATWPPAIWQQLACLLKTVRSHNSNAGQSRSRGHQSCTNRRLMKCQSEWVSADKVNDMHYRRQVDRNRQSNTCGLPNMQYILQAKINNNYIYIYIVNSKHITSLSIKSLMAKMTKVIFSVWIPLNQGKTISKKIVVEIRMYLHIQLEYSYHWVKISRLF